jgi:hypothetical protein
MAGEDIVERRAGGVGRRGWRYLAGAVVATIAAGFVAPVLSYAVLTGAAIGAWVTRQDAIVRWTLTLLALVLVAALVLGFSATADHGSTGGPISHRP